MYIVYRARVYERKINVCIYFQVYRARVYESIIYVCIYYTPFASLSCVYTLSRYTNLVYMNVYHVYVYTIHKKEPLIIGLFCGKWPVYESKPCICIYYTQFASLSCVQGGKDSYNVSSCRLFSAKEPLIIGLFCGKWPINMSHPMRLRHPVSCTLFPRI